jgi:hypothetical protein
MSRRAPRLLRPELRGLAAAGLVLASAGCPEPAPPPSTDAGTGTDAPRPVDASAPLDAFAPPDAYVRPTAPPLYTESVLDGERLAREALRIMGSSAAGGSGSCSDCHGHTRMSVRTWAEQAMAVRAGCLTDLEVSTDEAAAAMVACLDGPLGYQASHASIFSAAAHLGWFRFVFQQGAGASWETELGSFRDQAGMPAEGRMPLTQAQFDVVATWFLRGAPMADAVLPVDGAPTECVPWVSPEVGAHVEEMVTMGWAAQNREAGILMHGCAGATSPGGCLATAQPARDTPYGAGWDAVPGSTHRVLHTTTYPTSFWTRSSADGRFVAHGPGYVVDLQRDLELPIDSPYDPGFFPDNSAFVWPGQVCEQSLLTTATSRITFGEPECSAGDIGLYEHVGVALGGGDYWVVTGQFTSDNGGHGSTPADPTALFDGDSRQTLTRMVNDGTAFRTGSIGSAATPYEADAVISPSSRLLLTRMAGPAARPIGYRLYRIDETPAGPGRFTPTLRELGRYCFSGAKTAFSYDERWFVTHHYEGDDTANVYLVELATGRRTRITNMSRGQYALFPHFRSDGWIYFMVRGGTGTSGGERIVATDAALVLGAP